ncbi:hypothetical protein ACH5RR_010572 [Cinchona calisaya]|uniref:C2H2-type domain-containing protein n=1 Tax=Cinchona calisaya TaxID=153742 RepID=A0ABD3AJA4_9GENT
MEKVKFRSEKLKGTFRDNNAKLSFEKDIGTTPYGFSWAQRNYRCSFCKKEFKSAQALGGHMNVHRRDRAAKMRLSPSSLDCLNFNPNNYSNFSSSSSSPSYHAPNKLTPNYMTHHATSFTSFFSPSPASINEEKALGGHMNIHRKDRARNNKQPAKHDDQENYTAAVRRSYQQINPSHIQPHYVASHEASQVNYRSTFPASANSPPQPSSANNHYYMNNIISNDFSQQSRFDSFGVDQYWSMTSFNLPCGSSAHVEDIEKTRRVGGQEEELDLELRLGH